MNCEFEFICSYPFSYRGPLYRNIEYRKHGILYGEPYTHKPFITSHNHNYIEIEVIKEGEGIHHIKGNNIKFKKGSFHIIPQNVLHSFSIESNKITFHNLCILAKAMPFEITKMIYAAPLPISGDLADADYTLLSEYFNKLNDLQNSNEPFAKEKIYGYVLLILTTLLGCGESIKTQTNNPGYSYIEVALNYIKEKYNSQITLEALSGELHISPNYFSRIFSKHMGYTFNEYLNYYRVRIAENMILTTNNSLTQLAFDCGFGSLSSFSRAFNKFAGCSAKDFKGKFCQNI